ncbi:hypothetical protein V8E53_006304 [Lactarius tabidus]
MDELLPSSSDYKTTHHPRTPLRDNISPHSSSAPSSTQIDGPFKIQKCSPKRPGKILIRMKSTSSVSVPRVTTIDILPDEVLLQIFDFLQLTVRPVLGWHRLIHVCRRWRQVIFSSPRRLDLYLLCTHGTPVRKTLGLWQAFPIVIDYPNYNTKMYSNDEDGIIAALEHPDRISQLKLRVTRPLLGKVAAAAQEQFPILTQLVLLSDKDENVSALPSEFLGGSAPSLQNLQFAGIPFPTFPTFLSSATDLAFLCLHRIPHTSYISPEAMVAGLAALTRLCLLFIEFQSSTSRPDQSDTRKLAASPTRVVLPALTLFTFQGAGEYLEDLVAQVEAPRLDFIKVTHLNQLIFYVPQLFRFAGQVQVLQKARKSLYVDFYSTQVDIHLQVHAEQVESVGSLLHLLTACQTQGLSWEISDLARLLRRCSAVLSNVGHLSVDLRNMQPSWPGMDNVEWLELLGRFTAMETLFIAPPIAGYIANALEHVAIEMAPEILPALRLLCLEDEPLGRVQGFISARQLSAHPLTVANQRNEFRQLCLRLCR